MATVVITGAHIVGDLVAVRGTVDGRGYVVNLPKSQIDAAAGRAAKVQVGALALKAADDAAQAGVIDLTASVTL
jgi:hypothetical protein